PARSAGDERNLVFKHGLLLRHPMKLRLPRQVGLSRSTRCSISWGPRRNAECGVDGSGVLEREECELRTPLDAAIEAGEHLAGSALDQLRDLAARERAHRIGPAYRAGDLPHEYLEDVGGFGVRLGIDRADIGNLRSAELE